MVCDPSGHSEIHDVAHDVDSSTRNAVYLVRVLLDELAGECFECLSMFRDGFHPFGEKGVARQCLVSIKSVNILINNTAP